MTSKLPPIPPEVTTDFLAIIEKKDAEIERLRRIVRDLRGILDAMLKYEQAQAEYQDHMTVAGRHEKVVSDWRALRRAVLSKLREVK